VFSAAAFLVFCVACTVLAYKRHPIFGLYFYLGTLYVHPPSRWWGYMLPDPRWALLSAVITVTAVAFHRGKLRDKGVSWAANAPALIFILYDLWMWVQTAWALDTDSHIDGSIKLAKYLIAFWFVYRIVDSKEHLRDLLLAHMAGCGLLGLYARYTPREGNRLDGVGGPGLDDANTLGMYLATGVIACLALIMTQKGWRRWSAIVALPLIANGFVLANSRGAFLGLVAGGLVLAWCKAREHRRVFWILAMVGVVGFAAAVDKAFVERMFTIGDVARDDDGAEASARSRMAIYLAQLRMFADYPMGSGYRGTVVLSPKYLDRQYLVGGGVDDDAGRSSHNTFMTTLVEQGLPGALLFASLVVWAAMTTIRIRRASRAGADPELITLCAACSAGFAAVIVAGSAADYLMAEVQFWLLAALVAGLQLAGPRGSAATRLPSAPARPHALGPIRP
jgi:hypothetical protein